MGKSGCVAEVIAVVLPQPLTMKSCGGKRTGRGSAARGRVGTRLEMKDLSEGKEEGGKKVGAKRLEVVVQALLRSREDSLLDDGVT